MCDRVNKQKNVYQTISLVIMILFVVLCLSACSTITIGDGESGEKVKGNNDIVEVEKPLLPFDKIDSEGIADMRFHKSDEYKMVIKTDSNIHDYLLLDQKDDKILISMKPGSYDFKELNIDIYCPTLTVVEMSGAGDFEAVDTIETESFTIDISGYGDVKGGIVCQNFSASLSGYGDMSINGSSQNVVIDLSGLGDFEGRDFHAQNAIVSVSGMGGVKIYVEKTLKADVSGMGGVKYYGNPTVTKDVSGLGRIRKG